MGTKKTDSYSPSRSVAKWFWEQLSAFRDYVKWVLFAASISGILVLALPILVMQIYQQGFRHKLMISLIFTSILMLMVLIVKFLCDRLQQKVIHYYGKKLDVQLSASVVGRLLSLDMVHRPTSVGGMVNHYREFTKMRDFFTSLCVAVFVKLPLSFCFLFAVYYYAGLMVLIPLSGNIIKIAISLWQSRYTKANIKGSITATTVKQSTLVETHNCDDVSKSLGLENAMQSRWGNSVVKTMNYGRNYLNSQSLAQQAITSIDQIVFMSMIGVGAYLVSAEKLMLIEVIVSTLLSARAMDLGMAVHLLLHSEESRNSLQILDQAIFTPSDEVAMRIKEPMAEFKGAIECHQLSYQGALEHRASLENISLKINPGERVGIMGCGASQLLDCLGGLLAPTKGDLTLDGVSMGAIDASERQQVITLCTYLDGFFPMDLDANLYRTSKIRGVGVVDKAKKETGLAQALDARERSHFGTQLTYPHTLSLGQKQLARATRLALSPTPILVLDGIFAGLSGARAKQLREYLKQRPDGSTLVLRLMNDSLLELVDRVIVIENTNIAFDGSKEAFMRAQDKGEW